MIHIIDLDFLKIPRAIAVFAIPDEDGITLVECGPATTTATLEARMQDLSLDLDRVHTVLLTHIHFDHAGAAWQWAARGATIYVHPIGHKHMVDPSRLYGSAKQIYGAMMDQLWGEMHPIPAEQVIAVDDRAQLTIGGNRWVAHYTPGHAKHHIAWQLNDTTVFTGDVGGVMILGGPVVPPCPPPDIDIAAWEQSIARLRSLPAERFYLTHFGEVTNTKKALAGLEMRLGKYVDWMRPHAAAGRTSEEVVDDFTTFLEKELLDSGVQEKDLDSYRAANPPYMSAAGLLRWFDKYGG